MDGNKHPQPAVVSFTRVPVPCARSMKRDRAHMDLFIKKCWVKLIYVNGGRRFRIPWDLAFHYFFSFHLPWHFDIIASFKSTISSGEPKTHNGAWHLWRSTSCSIEEKWGGVMKRGGRETKGSNTEIWFFSSRARQAIFKCGGWNVTGGIKNNYRLNFGQRETAGLIRGFAIDSIEPRWVFHELTGLLSSNSFCRPAAGRENPSCGGTELWSEGIYERKTQRK